MQYIMYPSTVRGSSLSDNDRTMDVRVTSDRPSLMGPFPITQINDNGTVHFQQRIFNDNTYYTSNDYTSMNTYQHLIFHFNDLPHHNLQGECNMRENMRQNNHQYKVGDKILFKRKKNSKHEL